MQKHLAYTTGAVLLAILSCLKCNADEVQHKMLKEFCAGCHVGDEPEGEFSLLDLGDGADEESLELWMTSLERVEAEEMPPEDGIQLTEEEREELIDFLNEKIDEYEPPAEESARPPVVRRMNNREFANSIAEVLLIEDIGTHLPTADLIGDSLHHGFDTHAATLGFSKFHLEQYVEAVRKIVDATILSGDQPKAKRYAIRPTKILGATTSQNTKRPSRPGKRNGFDFLDPRSLAYFQDFETTPTTGWYRIKIECVGLDRGRYDEEWTGMYDADPIRLQVIMGDRVRLFDLPDKETIEIELDEWLAAGTRLRLKHPTDGLRLQGNGNFKFQNRITAFYYKKYEPQRYEELAKTFTKKRGDGRQRQTDDWHNWVDYWQGPRPRILGATIEGPIYRSWPPERQVALLGNDPTIAKADSILRPIAERAWRRPISEEELKPFVELVQSRKELGEIEALKEGIVALLVSPEFLLLNQPELTPEQRFVSKLSYLLSSTTPGEELIEPASEGELDSFGAIRDELRNQIESGRADAFLRAFPFAWLELNDINFMAPDPDYFKHYHRKLVSEDMIDEALHFFRHAAKENIPLPELLSANYSFINADLAKIYGIEDGPKGSTFERYTFQDGRRGGLLGMGAFLTSTADSLGTSPIHRAVYVMENFLGIHPKPPPADVEISEPDVRQAKTIKEILEAHRSDRSCASCHQGIDPYGYAFENFGPDGSWRDIYSNRESGEIKNTSARRRDKAEIPIDASAAFASGENYRDIIGFRKIMNSATNQRRFVRCFVEKLLTYANGEEPSASDYAEVEAIVNISAQHDFRIIETIAAAIDSPLFR